MIDRIIESFTKPKMEITCFDELIQSATIIVFLFLVVVIYLVVKDFLVNRKDKRK